MSLEIIRDENGLPVATRSQHETGHCPYREDQIYNRGVVDDSLFSMRGTAYHSCIKRYVKRLVASQNRMDAEEAALAFEEGIAEARAPIQVIAEVREIFDREVQHFELDLDSFIEVEDHRVEKTEDGMLYWFRADLVNGWPQTQELEVTDHKTYYVALTDVQARELYQTRYLIWAAMQIFPNWQTYRMTYRFPRLNKVASWVFYPDDFPMLDREVRAAEAARLQRYHENDWPAIPGDQCAFCSLKCPIYDDEDRSHVRVNSDESFERAAGWVIVAELRLKAAKKALKAYANVQGPQDVNGEIFGFRPTVSRNYPAAVVVDAVRAAGHEPTFRVTASALKTDCKIVPGLEADIAPSEGRKESARFGHKSLKATLKEAQEGEGEDDE